METAIFTTTRMCQHPLTEEMIGSNNHFQRVRLHSHLIMCGRINRSWTSPGPLFQKMIGSRIHLHSFLPHTFQVTCGRINRLGTRPLTSIQEVSGTDGHLIYQPPPDSQVVSDVVFLHRCTVIIVTSVYKVTVIKHAGWFVHVIRCCHYGLPFYKHC
ncbi:uncharacterized protein [Magallana gigas]|uniref:uncharacterized protein n=1 Tax=Magallana gigas TaxID=29159 RepID=UPI00333E5112